MSGLEISGNTTEEESAAIAAVVAHVVAEEAETLAAPPARPRQSDWVLAWRPRVPVLGSRPAAPVHPPGAEEE